MASGAAERRSVFCEIVAGRAAASIVYSDDTVLALDDTAARIRASLPGAA